MSYVKAAQELPYLTDREIETKALEYGLVDEISGGSYIEKREDSRAGSDEGGAVVNEGAVEAGWGNGIKND